MNTIANDGTYVAPRLVDATIDKAGDRHDTPASATHPVIQPATAAAMVPILQQVWCVGTAISAPRIDGYSVAGKTGTGYIAQNSNYLVVGPDGQLRRDGYKDAQGNRHYNASFAGFLPAENPQHHDPRHRHRSRPAPARTTAATRRPTCSAASPTRRCSNSRSRRRRTGAPARRRRNDASTTASAPPRTRSARTMPRVARPAAALRRHRTGYRLRCASARRLWVRIVSRVRDVPPGGSNRTH